LRGRFTPMVWKQAHSENRETRAKYGRSYYVMVFLGFPPDGARAMRGPALARPNRYLHRERTNPLRDNTRPLRVMLDPGLDRSDPVLQSILKLTRHEDVLELLCTSLDPNSVPQHAKRVEMERLERPDGENWSANLEDFHTWVPMIGGWEGLASYAFGDVQPDDAHLSMLTGQTARSLGCDLFLTANETLLEKRCSVSGWVADLGPVTPLELARILAVRFRRAGWLPTASNTTLRGGVYDVTVQEWLPAYLPIYRHFSSGEDSTRVLDYLDGILGNCALSLMALDRLACLHFAEDTEPANNTSVGEQQKEAASFVTSLTSALESLTWVLFHLANATADRRQVTFRKLVYQPRGKRDLLWTSAVSEYCPEATAALRDGFGPTLELVLHFRDLLQHHVPIPAGVGIFGETVRVGVSPRFIDKWKAGVLLTEPHPGENPIWPTSHEAMGVLPDAVMPYPFFRSCAFDMLALLQAVLSCIGSKLSLAERVHPNPHFSSWLEPDAELTELLAKAI